MAWDPTRPVPWQRMMREWLLYVAIMAVVFVVFFRDSSLVGIFAGLLASGPIFLVFGYVMAKFGYERKSLKQLRSEPRPPRRRASSDDDADDSAEPAPRPKPAPTKRTAGSGRPNRPSKKRR